MSREASSKNVKTYHHFDELCEIFQNGARPYAEHKIGLETEKIGVYKSSMEALSFDGPSGIEAILKLLAKRDGWDSHEDQGRVIALSKDQMAITLEPGGQLELSGGIYRYVAEVEDELTRHLTALCEVSRPLGVSWLGFGIQPFSSLSDISWVPKSRYEIMKNYYKGGEALAHHMMKMTAATQVNLDYSSEEDARKKVRVGVVAGCFISAMLANSCVEEGGELSGYCSKRLKIWKHTDKDRCGTPNFFMDGSFSFERYRDYALDVPMYFIYRDGAYLDRTSMTFREYFRENKSCTADDWENHLTTLFPDVRMKNHLEFRTMDATEKKLSIAATAFWVGLFASNVHTDEAYQLAQEFDLHECSDLHEEIALRGMDVKVKNMKIGHFCRIALELAKRGLDHREQGESTYLEPLFAIAESGMSPAQQIIKRWPISISELCT